MILNLIAAVDADWGIGRNGDLLCHNPVDMKFFREMTKGHPVVLGRKTLESFPGQKPLKNRVNIVLSARHPETEEAEGETRLVYCQSKEKVLERLAEFEEDEVFVIGGASIYRLFLPECRKAYITQMKNHLDPDTYFPNLDEAPDWRLAKAGEWQEYEDIVFRFCVYERENKPLTGKETR